MRGGDEYGNHTLVLRLPGERAVVLAWNIPLRHVPEPNSGYTEYGLVDLSSRNGQADSWSNPVPLSWDQRDEPAPDGWIRVTREVYMTPWRSDGDDLR